MTSARILGTARTGTAHPPLTGVKPTSVWLAERINRPRPTLLDRLLRRDEERKSA